MNRVYSLIITLAVLSMVQPIAGLCGWDRVFVLDVTHYYTGAKRARVYKRRGQGF
jgi:hypothetical protein